MERELAVAMVRSVIATVMLTDPEVVRSIRTDLRRADALMPVVDPTMHIRTGAKRQYDEACIEAFLAFREELDRIKTELLEVDE